MTDKKLIEQLNNICEFTHEMDGDYCIAISFHDENRFGSTIRRHPLKREIIQLVAKFPKLKQINLRKSKLGHIPDMTSTELEHIDISCNDLENVPKWIMNQKSLLSLNLGSNRIETVPDLSDMPLEILKLHKNVGIRNLPEFGSGLKLLNLFILPHITEIPKRVFDLPLLEAFTFGVTKASHLPSLASLTKLRWLTLSVNRFEELPEDICSLEKLEGLRLAKNKLKKLPKHFGNLGLKVLTLYGNEITELPESFFDLNLEKLNLALNPLNDKKRVIDSFTNIDFFRI